ncbi:deoxyribose-phosphate aldolase [Streptococcus agalactiae LMG 14747]|uniref:Deoxyribose-phosphate aldolase n=2 Tax=Streptococcus TaxID=1301 RepID=V6Z2I2_STRAG|nr:deoxyribose-phosphate aldolase [Streptococcus acidominimus]ESV54928.1 deoxyribose-phosphate aldolase [Streptococcus agalactiae LMG 14747]SNV32291.1 Deoxyribose-phosphate aldolase [Streptococcus acidominimus]
MDVRDILKTVDHTLLATTATWSDIQTILDDAIAYKTASACIPASYVKQAAEYVAGKLAICTVIGFPNGYSTTASKVFECQDAIKNGADEIDMVINLTDVKNGNFDAIEAEIRQIKEVCQDHILKVIVETCQLTKDEIIELCGVVTRSGADFIKTSTGFSTAGATFEDVSLMAEHVGPQVKIKAAGGISSLEDAERFINFGASRLGTSRIIKLVKNQDVEADSY